MCRSKALDAVSAAKDDAERQARLSADNAERERLAAQQEAEKGRVLMQFVSKVVLADARNAIETSPDKYHLLLTDPPYGQQFSSGRRVASARKASIANDDPSIAIALLEEVLLKAYSRMADHSNALIFTGWRLEPQFRAAIERAGFEIRGSLVWVKNNHGAGDLSGCFSPKHERIIHAVKGNPKLLVRYPDVLEGKDKQDSLHPTEKPIDLLTRLIEATTEPGQCVVDPFAGSGSTLLAAHKLGRDFWGCEIDPGWHGRIGDALIAILKGEAAA
jgi:site-specific DNA-methyltransferase (adenine-specific)